MGCLPLASDICYYFVLETSADPIRYNGDDLVGGLAAHLKQYHAPELRDILALIHEGRHISYRPFDILLMPQPWHMGPGRTGGRFGSFANPATHVRRRNGGRGRGRVGSRHGSVAEALAAYSVRRESWVRPVYENYREAEVFSRRDGRDTVMVESFKFLTTLY